MNCFDCRSRYLRALSFGRTAIFVIFLSADGTIHPQTVPEAVARNGKIPGVKIWELPDAPCGTKPDQCWLAVGSSQCGDIYISGHDHYTNSMLYRLDHQDGILRYVGDAKTASEAADNWLAGETAQKFHTRPVEHDGRIYVATLDRSSIDMSYLQTRGFHWYSYEPSTGIFSDLSASEPGGTGGEHLQLVTIQVDPVKNILYGATIPQSRFVSYDIHTKETQDLGRPQQWQTPRFYTNRFMWVDSRSRLYVTGGNQRDIWYKGEPADIFSRVWFYEPDSGYGTIDGFDLVTPDAIDMGQWNRENTKCYASDDRGSIYCFTDSGPSWKYLGTPDFPRSWEIWMMQVSADEEKVYLGRSDENVSIYEYDLTTKETELLCTIEELDDVAGARESITGYDSWDNKGNFYFSCFTMYDGNNVLMLGLNPAQLKSEMKMMPLVEITTKLSPDSCNIIISSNVQLRDSCVVLWETVGYANNLPVKSFGCTVIPKDAENAEIPVSGLPGYHTDSSGSILFRIVPDGNDYITGESDSVEITNVNVPRGSPQISFRNLKFAMTGQTQTGTKTFIVGLSAHSGISIDIFNLNGMLVESQKGINCLPGINRIALKNKFSSGVFVAKLSASAGSGLITGAGYSGNRQQ